MENGKFWDRILFYHPLDLNRKFFVKKNDIFKNLESLHEIVTPKNFLKIYLSAEDKIKLINIGKYLEDKLKTNLNTGNYEKISFYFEKVKMLKNLEENFFLVIYQTLENSIIKFFYTKKERIRKNIYLKLFEKSKKKIAELIIGLNFFNKKIRNKIDIDELESFFYCQKTQYEQDKKIIKNLKDETERSKRKFEYQTKIIENIKYENRKDKKQHEKRLEKLLIQIDQIKSQSEINEIKNQNLIKEYTLLKTKSINIVKAKKILEEKERKMKERGYLKSLYERIKSFFKSLF